MSTPIHPLLFALYPILALLASNGDQVGAGAALRPGLLSVGLGLAMLFLFRLPYRDSHRAAALASLGLVVFYSYGHIYDLLKSVEVLGTVIGRHRLLVPAVAVVVSVGAWASSRIHRRHETTAMLNLVGLALVGMPLLTIAGRAAVEWLAPQARTVHEALELDRPAVMPDIYYIVLDAYTRQDVLREDFGVDNRPFLAELERLGFDHARCAQSNYAQTELTLAATLNLDYVDRLDEFPRDGRDRTPLLFLIRDSVLRRTLESLGYTVVAFETGYAWSEWQNADVYLRPEGKQALWLPLSPFELLLFDSSALTIVSDARAVLPPELGGFLEGPLELHRERVLFVLDELARLPERDGPKFVFAHIVAPHQPYLLAPDPDSARAQASLIPDFDLGGEEGSILGYRNQVLYLNDRMVGILERIIEESEVPPIVILQGDHGPDDTVLAERMAILHAVRLPGAAAPMLERATPVNAFRRVLSSAFGADLPPLPDRSYYSGYQAPFAFREVPNDCQPE